MLFDRKDLYKLKAVVMEDYISFDDDFPFAVQILDEKDSEFDMKVFRTEDEAIKFRDTYNKV
ncbi:hypothetical protein N5U23_04580 [Aliarcobacter butzleri]|uniref:hypothetical protein n=1 Tax=Aliarcobacter butzleri TaxID=28197 RepID=UPI0021B3B11D|nr:hypothetical protein [Aliarcobacter butzleri]MCT7563288.1 hypothetical protein [Aliarcobacter butzleri]MCT7648902.1 hypothetical protein [Aliarcobacter butzleri]